MATKASYIPQRISFLQKIKIKIFQLFRLRRAPVLRLYTGFGSDTVCIIYGHALSLSPLPRRNYRRSFLVNTFSLLRMFMVKPKRSAMVKLVWQETELETITEKDGFFKFEWKPPKPLPAGTYKLQAFLMKKKSNQKVTATAEGDLIVPSATTFAFISDIDDTFLVSHSSNLRKRLFVLFTENARSRLPFEAWWSIIACCTALMMT